MGELAAQLDSIRIRVTALNGDLEAELRNRNEVTISFSESVYEFVDEGALERALAKLARQLYAGWVRQYRDVIDSTDNLNIYPDDQHDFNFREEADSVEASGVSSDGRITVSTVGMQDFSAKIERGTVRDLSEREFVARSAGAASSLIEDYMAKVAVLKSRYYG